MRLYTDECFQLGERTVSVTVFYCLIRDKRDDNKSFLFFFFFFFFGGGGSETRMTASVLRQDPNK